MAELALGATLSATGASRDEALRCENSALNVVETTGAGRWKAIAAQLAQGNGGELKAAGGHKPKFCSALGTRGRRPPRSADRARRSPVSSAAGDHAVADGDGSALGAGSELEDVVERVGYVPEMSEAPAGVTVEWTTVEELRDHSQEWARIWKRTAIRPTEIPDRIRTLTSEPVPMPRVPDHQIRVVGVQAVGTDCPWPGRAGLALHDEPVRAL